MPYLICPQCEIYYEIEANFDIRNLEVCEKCNGNLQYYETIDEYYDKSDETSIKDNTDRNEDYSKINKKTYDYNLIAISGLAIALLGLCVLIFAYISPFIFISQNIDNLNAISSIDTTFSIFTQIILIYTLSFVLMAAGSIIYIWGKRKNNHLKKSSGGIKKLPYYLSKLPERYFILNNVKIPLKKVNYDHIVIGPTGIFLIKIKKIRGQIIINENEWITEKGNNKNNRNHGRKLKTETVEFSRFLTSHGLNIPHLMINTILAFSNDNFKIEKKPSFYEVLNLEQIPDFITGWKRKMDKTDAIEAMVLLEPYSREILKT